MRWRLGRPPTVETLFVLAFALIGLRLGLRPIGDNSTFVHVRTGIDAVAGRGLPRHDPYSFTAAGEPWVVQSWLVSYVYGTLHRLAGFEAVVLFHGVVYGALAAVMATLARTQSARRTCLAAGVAIGMGVATWSPRPLAVALLAFALTVLVVERRWAPWWLLPIGWVWVNSHGSWVLGGVWLVVVAVSGGAGRDARRYLPWWLGGVVLGAVNPLGPKLLLFPLTLVSKAPNFERVVEWRAPTFRGPFGVITLLALVGVIVVLARAERRLSLPEIAPAAVFLAMALVAQRNLAPAAVVLAPVLGRALATERQEDRAPLNTAIAAVLGVAALLFAAVTLGGAPLDLDGYPVAAAAHVPRGTRTASTDIGGCYLVLERGRDANVFVDDRYDVYPERVAKDYLALYDGRPSATAILDRHRVDTVLWPADKALVAILEREPDEWRRVYGDEDDDDWVVFVRA